MAIMMPKILPIVILMDNPKVITKIPRFRTSGESIPKVCPKFKNVPGNRLPIKPPITIPAKIIRKQAQLFFPFMKTSVFFCSYVNIKKIF